MWVVLSPTLKHNWQPSVRCFVLSETHRFYVSAFSGTGFVFRAELSRRKIEIKVLFCEAAHKQQLGVFVMFY